MAEKTNEELAREVEELAKSMADVVGPIRETLSRVKIGLVGSETGDTPGLIARVRVLEAQLVDLKEIVDDLEAWADKCDERVDKVEKTEAKLDTVAESLAAVKSARSWWFKLIIGGLVSGAIGLVWFFIQGYISK